MQRIALDPKEREHFEKIWRQLSTALIQPGVVVNVPVPNPLDPVMLYLDYKEAIRPKPPFQVWVNAWDYRNRENQPIKIDDENDVVCQTKVRPILILGKIPARFEENPGQEFRNTYWLGVPVQGLKAPHDSENTTYYHRLSTGEVKFFYLITSKLLPKTGLVKPSVVAITRPISVFSELMQRPRGFVPNLVLSGVLMKIAEFFNMDHLVNTKQ